MRLEWFLDFDHTLTHSIQSEPSNKVELNVLYWIVHKIVWNYSSYWFDFWNGCWSSAKLFLCQLWDLLLYFCGVMQNMGRATNWNQTSFLLWKMIKHIAFFHPGWSQVHWCIFSTKSWNAISCCKSRSFSSTLEIIKFMICSKVLPGIDRRSRRHMSISVPYKCKKLQNIFRHFHTNFSQVQNSI